MKVGMQTPGGEASSNKVVKYSKVQTEVGSTSTANKEITEHHSLDKTSQAQ